MNVHEKEANEMLAKIDKERLSALMDNFDFDKYYIEYLGKEWFPKCQFRTMSEYCKDMAKHFYELGLKHGSEK